MITSFRSMRLFFLGIFLWSFTVAEPIIETKYGKIRGFEYETKSGHIAEIYLGIPYATPPIGDLRFEKPQPPSIWEDVKNCTKFGPTCLPHSKKAILSPAPSEDCLTLNVISPKEKTTTTGHPILVWIHGGGYEIGSTSIYGYKDFADIYIPNDIIVVTVQYRLGVYGFFSIGDSEIPGNYGLFDQTAALKFINQNIVNFGGDSSRVTVWGLSAGGSSVGQLSLSPYSNDLISGSIEMSGSPWASWALGYNVPQHSKDLAQALECHDEIKKCMKERTVDEIFIAVQRIGETTKDLNPIKFGPVIDEDFIPKHPMEMVNEVAPKPALIGLGNKESTFFTILALYPCIHSFGLTKEEFKSWNRQKLIEKLKDLIHPDYFEENTEKAIGELVEYYVQRESTEDDGYDFYLDRYSEFLSDIIFNVPIVEGIRAKKDAGWPVFAYSFDHYNDAIWPEGFSERLKGSPHVNEFPYMFNNFELGKFDIDAKEQIVMNTIQQTIISFVKNRIPVHQYSAWEDAGTEKDVKYLSISPKPKMKKGLFNESAAFWTKMRKYGYDVPSLLKVAVSNEKEEL